MKNKFETSLIAIHTFAFVVNHSEIYLILIIQYMSG